MDNNCDSCIFEKRLENGKRALICLQGHVRQMGGGNIEKCHAWKPQPKCWCEYSPEERNNWNVSVKDKEGIPVRVWGIKCCPHCGRKL